MIDIFYEWFCFVLYCIFFHLLRPDQAYTVCLIFWCHDSVNSCFCFVNSWSVQLTNGQIIACLSRTPFLVVSFLGAGNSRNIVSGSPRLRIFAIQLLSTSGYVTTSYLPHHYIEQINKITFNFIWDGKPAKIKRKTLIGAGKINNVV